MPSSDILHEVDCDALMFAECGHILSSLLKFLTCVVADASRHRHRHDLRTLNRSLIIFDSMASWCGVGTAPRPPFINESIMGEAVHFWACREILMQMRALAEARTRVHHRRAQPAQHGRERRRRRRRPTAIAAQQCARQRRHFSVQAQCRHQKLRASRRTNDNIRFKVLEP